MTTDPPGRLNVALALTAYAAAGGCLWLASQGGWAMVAGAIGFSFAGNTIFSLLHESVHGIFHRRRAVNDAFGCLSAAFFPTGYTFQRACHLGHHRRNRTDAEMFDYLGELVDPSAPRPGFLRTYLSLWGGPRLTTEPSPARIDAELEERLG